MALKQEKRLNLIEIARLAGTSKSTVSRVLRNKPRVSPETRARVKQVISEQGYRPSIFARGLAGAKTGLIGVLGRWMESGFFAEVIRGIDGETRRNDGHVLSSFAESAEEYIEIWRDFVGGGQVDGVIMIAPPFGVFSEAIQPGDSPVVLCAARSGGDGNPWSEFPSVTLNNRQAMRDLLTHLSENGCRRLVHLQGGPDNYDAIERSRAFTEYVREVEGMTGTVVPGAWTSEMGLSRAREYLATHDDLPDAFVGFNDAVALGIIEALDEHNISVPQAVAVTGWDDIPFASLAGVTTVRIPMVELGQTAARLLFQQMSGEDTADNELNVILDMSLVVRKSTTGI